MEKLDSSELIGKKILVLIAHPDDESFLAAGTLHKNQLAGGQNFLICASLGEKGNSHLDKPLSEDELCEVRKQELQNATQVIGVHKLKDLNFPDGGLVNHFAKLKEAIAPELKELQPDLVMSFGPDGATGHRDHITIGKVAEELATEFRIALAQFCFAEALIGEMKDWLIQRRHQIHHYEENFELIVGNVIVPIDGKIKLQALHCYSSQIDQADPFSGFPDHLAESLLTEECFRLIK